MKKWTDIIKPRNEIINEQINESTFAARLDEVYQNRASLFYKDPVLFFDNSHITQGMKKLLELFHETLHIQKCPGNNVIELQTTFGGGKTHCMVGLFHLANRPDLFENHPNLKELKLKPLTNPPKTNVCVLVGMDYNVSKQRTVKIHGKNTPLKTWWGEIAYQLGGEKAYDIIAQNDQDWTPPGKSTLNAMFESIDGISLILIDELVHYLINVTQINKDYFGLAINFFQQFVEEVSNHRNVVLVFSLATAQKELVNELGRQAFQTIDKHTKRHKTTIEPVQYEEVYHIIRRRLFEPLGLTQQDEITRICEEFRVYYDSKQKFFPSEVIKNTSGGGKIPFSEKFKLGYPFHPALIDVLYQKWGPHPDFQRARGILRLFAKILQAIYKNVDSDIIMMGNVPISDVLVKTELLSYLDSHFSNVITTDFGRAKELEEHLKDDYLTFHLGQSLITSIFFHSQNVAQANPGATKEDLCLAILKPEIKYPALITDMLETMKNYLFHLFETGDRYYLLTKANPISMIISEKENISQKPDAIETKIESLMGKAIPSAHKVILWPNDSKDIPDEAQRTIIAMSPKYVIAKGSINLPSNISSQVIEWIDKRGANFREKKNGLVFAFVEQTEYNDLWDKTLELMAVENIINSPGINGILDKDQIQTLKNKKKGLEETVPKKIIGAYGFLGRPSVDSSSGTALTVLNLYTIDNSNPIFVERVKEEMIKRDWLLPNIGRKIIPPTFKEFISTQDLWYRQFEVLGLELLVDENTLLSAIQAIVLKKSTDNYGFGILKPNEKIGDQSLTENFSYWVEPGSQIDLKKIKKSSDHYLIAESLMLKIIANTVPPLQPEEPPTPEPPKLPESPKSGSGTKPPEGEPPIPPPTSEPPEPPKDQTNEIEMEITVPWNRVNDLRKLVDICNVFGQYEPQTVGEFHLKFTSPTKLPKMTAKNIKKYLEDLKGLWGENIKIKHQESE